MNEEQTIHLLKRLLFYPDHFQNLLEPEALGKLSTELAEQANAWSLMLPLSVLSCELLKSLEISFVALKFLPFSMNGLQSFGEFLISPDWNYFQENGFLNSLLVFICYIYYIYTLVDVFLATQRNIKLSFEVQFLINPFYFLIW